VCANGHPQLRPGAKFCYLDGAPVSLLGKPPTAPMQKGPLINGRYQTAAELGRGGMGVSSIGGRCSSGRARVCAERNRRGTLQPVSERPEIVKAFQREANLLQRLDHPNIVKVYDSFQIAIKHYMVMDLVLGKMLEDLLETSPGGFPEARVLEWAEQLCDALSYLHSQTPPIIYRDLKPQNVMVEDASGAIKIIDFGIAREFKGGKKKGDTIKFGTEGYAPPEQYGKGNVETSPASDVYALGALLHQLLSGKDPTQNPFNFDFLILSRPPISASSKVVDALKHALDNLPQKRVQTIDEFRQALTGQAAPKAKRSPPPAGGAQSQSRMSGSRAPSPIGSPPLPPPSRAGGLQLSDAQLDLGQIEKGGLRPAPRTFTVTSSGLAQVAARENWLVVMPAR
jgi:serine/threonine-protein kinase